MTRVKLVQAQDFVDALRQGEFYKVARFIQFIYDKYTPILKKTIAADELLPCLCYELAFTDLNEDDLTILSVVEVSVRDDGDLQCNLGNIAHAVQVTLCMQFLPGFKEIPQSPTKDLITNKDSILNSLTQNINSLVEDEEIEGVDEETTTKVISLFKKAMTVRMLRPENEKIQDLTKTQPTILKFLAYFPTGVKFKQAIEFTSEYEKDLTEEINALFSKCDLPAYGIGKGANIGLLCSNINKLKEYPALQKEVGQMIRVRNLLKKMKSINLDSRPKDIMSIFNKGYQALKQTASPTPAWKKFAIKVGTLLGYFDKMSLVRHVRSLDIFQKPSKEKFEDNASYLLNSPHSRCC